MGKFLKGVATVAIAAAAAEAGGTAYFYNRTMKRSNVSVERTMKMSGTDWNQYSDLLQTRKAAMLAQPHEDVYIKSFDGLKLHATWFPGKDTGIDGAENGANADTDGSAGTGTGDGANSDITPKKVAICFHGYTSKGMSDYVALSDYYLRNGFAMLLPDQRTHGESEGEYIGFGCLDRFDAMRWIDWVIKKCGEDVKIMLHGTSMGGATVLMASGLKLPSQVECIVSDCAFTSAREVFTHVLKTMYHIPPFPMIDIADAVNRRNAGYGLDDCNSAREVRKAKVPIFFIHGDADTFVPCYMCEEIYENCASPKKKLIVEGATHAESYYKDMQAYEDGLDEWIGKYMT